MSWFQMESGFRDHPKLKKLARDLDVSHNEAKGMIASLWCWCLDHAVDGDLSSFDHWDLADAAGWDADPSIFVHAMVEHKLLDATGHGLLIHEWMDRAGSFREALRKQKSREKKREEAMSRDCPVTVPTTGRNVSDKEDREDRPDRTEKTERTDKEKALRAGLSVDTSTVAEHYVKIWPRRAKQTKDKATRAKIKARLGEGYSVEDLCLAIDGNSRSEFHTQGGYNGLELIVRDPGKVDKFIAIAKGETNGDGSPPTPKSPAHVILNPIPQAELDAPEDS